MRQRTLAAMPARVATADLRTALPPPKEVDPRYLSLEHRSWRSAVLARGGYRCERCGCRAGRLFADHIVEIKDDPSRAFDLTNGQVLCGSCHTTKTVRERDKRFAR
jgi:5-methylcytosine-specific restriction protein A